MTTVEQPSVLGRFHLALGAIERITKDDSGGERGGKVIKYASLTAVLTEVKRVCEIAGLEMSQTATAVDGMLAVYTTLFDSSGDSWTFQPLMMKMPADPQAVGGAITYARRYALVTMFAIPVEDDDAAEATRQARRPADRRTEAEAEVRELIAAMDTATRTDFVQDFKIEFGVSLTDLAAPRHGDALGFTKQWINEQQAPTTETGDPE